MIFHHNFIAGPNFAPVHTEAKQPAEMVSAIDCDDRAFRA